MRVVNNDTLVPLFSHLPGYGLVGVRGALKFGEGSELFVDFENIFDKSYRGISWGIDGAGRGVTALENLDTLLIIEGLTETFGPR